MSERDPATGPAAGSSEKNAPGWYPYGARSQLARWDGVAWTGERTSEPAVASPPPWRRRTRAGRGWLLWLLLGQVLCVASGLAAGRFGQWWSWTSIVGYTLYMVGSVRLVARYLHFEQLEGIRRLYALGVIAGAVAVALALPLETWSLHALGTDATLWLAGPIEETAKLLVPFLALVFAGDWLREPRRGLAVVVASAATFGGLEGVKWQIDTSYQWDHFFLSLVRPGVEIFHPVLTGVAGAVIWLSAWRARRRFTSMGVKAFFLVVAVHAIHDGLATLAVPHGQKLTLTLPRYNFSQALGHGVLSGTAGVLISLAFFVLFRHSARELVPPSDLATTPPRWRPRIKPWSLRARQYDSSVRAIGEGVRE